jgi:hypothetical protein
MVDTYQLDEYEHGMAMKVMNLSDVSSGVCLFSYLLQSEKCEFCSNSFLTRTCLLLIDF